MFVSVFPTEQILYSLVLFSKGSRKIKLIFNGSFIEEGGPGGLNGTAIQKYNFLLRLPQSIRVYCLIS